MVVINLVNICKYVEAVWRCLLTVEPHLKECCAQTGSVTVAGGPTNYFTKIISKWRPGEDKAELGRLNLFVLSKKVVKLYEPRPASQPAGLNPIIKLEGREEAGPESLDKISQNWIEISDKILAFWSAG